MVIRRAPWLRPGRAVDGVLATACVLPGVWQDLQSGLFNGSPIVNRPAPLGITVTLGLATGVAVFDRRSRPLLLYAGAVACWLVAGAWPAVPVAQYAVGAYLRSLRLRVVLTVAMVAAVSMPMWLAYGADASLPISLAMCILPTLAGLFVASRRAQEQLLVDQARAEERAQIARDMHDVVTHRVSLMVLHATALASAEGRGAVEVAGQIQIIGRAALEELRTLVGVLRDGGDAPLRPQPGVADLAELVDASRALGLTVELSVEDGLRAPALVEQAVYRVVQEALTNVHRHARTARTTVVVASDDDGVSLAVRNGASAVAATAAPRGGHGLLGISERVRLVGGTLSTRRQPDGGFEVLVRIPVAREAWEMER
ncbi:histidine kinase [Micromonospora sp. NPDC047738]|uniref:sensor histidine kinase n=1 Tax=Micromonospora sp. NPDC047738 TaxID=3155741 RepID=UPI0033E201A8